MHTCMPQQVQCAPKVMLGLLCSMLHLSPSIKCAGVTQSLECTAWRWKWTRYNSWRQESIVNRIMLDGQQGVFSLVTTGCHHSSTSTHPQSCDTISGRCPLDPPGNTCDWAVHTHYKLQPGFSTTSTRIAVHITSPISNTTTNQTKHTVWTKNILKFFASGLSSLVLSKQIIFLAYIVSRVQRATSQQS